MGVLLELPADLRAELKDPLGPIFTDPSELLEATGGPVVAVGDIVTYHLLQVRHPDVALVDGKTKRERVEREVRDAIEGFDHRVEVENPAGTLTEELLDELRAAIVREGTTVIEVLGEEDLAALPAILASPEGTAVVYGQPDEGMVLATVDPERRAGARSILDQFVGNHDRTYAVLEIETA